MGKWLTKLRDVILTVKAVFVLIPFLVMAWTYVVGMLNDQPINLIVVLAIAALGGTAFALYWVLRIAEYLYCNFGKRKEINKAVERFSEIAEAGIQQLSIGDAATIWAGEHAPDWVINARRARLIKAAIQQKISEPHERPLPKVTNRNTAIVLDDVIQFVKSGGDVIGNR